MTPSQLTRLKQLHVAFGKCLEFAQDCRDCAYEASIRTGEWEKKNQDAEQALTEFEELIAELEKE